MYSGKNWASETFLVKYNCQFRKTNKNQQKASIMSKGNKTRPFELDRHWRTNFDYKHLGSHDFLDLSPKNLDLVLTIKNFYQEEIKGQEGTEWCNVVIFSETEINGFKVKPMIVNKTNLKLLEEALKSENARDFLGKKVALYVKRGVNSFQGKVNALRFKSRAPKVRIKQGMLDSEIDKAVDYFLKIGRASCRERV